MYNLYIKRIISSFLLKSLFAGEIFASQVPLIGIYIGGWGKFQLPFLFLRNKLLWCYDMDPPILQRFGRTDGWMDKNNVGRSLATGCAMC